MRWNISTDAGLHHAHQLADDDGSFLLVAVLAGIALRRSTPNAAAAKAEERTAPDPHLEPAPASIQLTVVATSSEAKVTLDGIPIEVPYRALTKRDERDHELRAGAPGFASLVQIVRFDVAVIL